jgi:hypothetical protein
MREIKPMAKGYRGQSCSDAIRELFAAETVLSATAILVRV